MCIRCSGIHRSMGTHISKVKSVDLDTWTPEQMAVREVALFYILQPLILCVVQSIQKWGNRRANVYWEAHLKAGHAPPDQCVRITTRTDHELTIVFFTAKLTLSSAPNMNPADGPWRDHHPKTLRFSTTHLRQPQNPLRHLHPRQLLHRPVLRTSLPLRLPLPFELPHPRARSRKRGSSSPARSPAAPPLPPPPLQRQQLLRQLLPPRPPRKTTSSRSTSTAPPSPHRPQRAAPPPQRKTQSRTSCPSSPPLQ